MNWSTKRYVFLKNYSFSSYISVFFQLVAFVREYSWYKAIRMGHSMSLEFKKTFQN